MPHRLTLTRMAEEIQARKLSPVELLEAHLRHIERLNPQVNAFIRVLAAEARQAARAAEAAQMRGEWAGPLHGIPVSIKDSFDIAGYPTTVGSRFLAGQTASRDADVVKCFKQSGAIPFAKTNCPEFLSNYETDNFIAGRTNNPWNLERTPGGSSGGEAAAIAARFSPGGIGSDGGGSVRVPAHFCGIAGLKPTPGRISGVGHVPELNEVSALLGVAGPMARNARDLKLLFETLDSRDPAFPRIRETELRGLRIGLVEQFYQVPVQAAVRSALLKAAAYCAEIGAAVEIFEPQGLQRAPNLWWFFFGLMPSRTNKARIAGREDQAHWTGTEFLNQALHEPDPTALKVVENLTVRDNMRAFLLRQMEDVPVLLLPACGIAAFPHRQRRYHTDGKDIGQFEAMMPATFGNLLGLPAVTIPIGFDADGLPVGVQLSGRPNEEELLLDLAIAIEDARGPFPAPPGYAE